MRIVVVSGSPKRPLIGVVGSWDPPREQHNALFQQLATDSVARNLESLVVTLEPPPEQVADGVAHWPRHTDLAWRLEIQRQCGIHCTAIASLDRSDTQRGASPFIENLASVFTLSELCLGQRQTFGRFRPGSQSEVELACQRHGIHLRLLDPEEGIGQVPKHVLRDHLEQGRLWELIQVGGSPPVWHRSSSEHVQMGWPGGRYLAVAQGPGHSRAERHPLDSAIAVEIERDGTGNRIKWPDPAIDWLAFLAGPGDRLPGLRA